MKIVIHDLGNYSFPVQLARRMAADGHEIHYLHSDFYEVKGNISRQPGDPPNFHIHTISVGQKHKRYDFLRRGLQENRYASLLNRRVDQVNAEWVISCNTPLITSFGLSRHCARTGRKYVHWAQDIHANAIKTIFSRKFGPLGRPVGMLAARMERSIIESADALIVISGDFINELSSMGIKPRRSFVIPNWMPLDEIVPTPKVNPWSTKHGLSQTTNVMYVGTLSLKHDIQPFVELSRHFASEKHVRIVVVSGGLAYEALKEERQQLGTTNLVLFGWQKYEDLSSILGCGDVLFATISTDAARFSVPCKVLTYASAGKPILAHMPKENLVSRIVVDNNLGVAVESGNRAELVSGADRLIHDAEYRAGCARRARAYAEKTFDIDEKARDFYKVLGSA